MTHPPHRRSHAGAVFLAVAMMCIAAPTAVRAQAQQEPAAFPTGAFVIDTAVSERPNDWMVDMVLEFHDDGSFELREGDDTLAAGSIQVGDETMRIRGETGTRACAGEESNTAFYGWEWDGTRLTMHMVDDPCMQRRVNLDGTVFVRVPPPESGS